VLVDVSPARMRLFVGVSLENDHHIFLENNRRFGKPAPASAAADGGDGVTGRLRFAACV